MRIVQLIAVENFIYLNLPMSCGEHLQDLENSDKMPWIVEIAVVV